MKRARSFGYSPPMAPASENRQALPWIGPDDPPPFEVVNLEGKAPVLLTCDHASAAIPRALRRLGLEESVLSRHIAWDIGAGEMARALARRLDALAVLSGYSRLLIDCNRSLASPTAIATEADGVPIPGNANLAPDERRMRAEAFYWPYHNAIADRLADFNRRGVSPAVLSVHSFTPVLGGFERPWQIGVLWDEDPRIAKPLMAILKDRHGVAIGDNQPYAGRDNYGYTMEHHVVKAGLPQVLVEIRQDLIDTRHGVEAWFGILGPAFEEILSDPELYRQAWFAERR